MIPDFGEEANWNRSVVLEVDSFERFVEHFHQTLWSEDLIIDPLAVILPYRIVSAGLVLVLDF